MLKIILEYTKLFVLLIKTCQAHALEITYLKGKQSEFETQKISNLIFHFSYAVYLIIPYTFLHAFYNFGDFMCLYCIYVFLFSEIKKNSCYLHIPLLHISIILFPALLYTKLRLLGTDHKNLPRSLFMWKQLHRCM